MRYAIRSWSTAILGVVGAAALSGPAFASPGFAGNVPQQNIQQSSVVQPGTVNYVEGAVYLDGQSINEKNIGTAQMNAGEDLTTGQGRAEILLNPGIYLRMDDNSAVKMISPAVTPTQVEIERGRASVEVDQLSRQNVVQIIDDGMTTQLVKPGFYEFSAVHPRAIVISGQAEVQLPNSKWEEIKSDHDLNLAAIDSGARVKEAKYQPDRASNQAQDQLMNWSKLRSQYLAQAQTQMAYEYGGYPGWYWDPWMWGYAYLGPGPFWGWGGWGWGPGFYGPAFYGGFHGGIGGFHGGMGGFHGGGMGRG